jgi:hypothetical protein
MSCSKICLGDLNTAITIVRRNLVPPLPGSAAPRHDYHTVLSPRAKAETMAGRSEFAQVSITVGGATRRATDVFTIRYSRLLDNTRDMRVRDAEGSLYEILSATNLERANKWLKLHCAFVGKETVAAAR